MPRTSIPAGGKVKMLRKIDKQEQRMIREALAVPTDEQMRERRVLESEGEYERLLVRQAIAEASKGPQGND